MQWMQIWMLSAKGYAANFFDVITIDAAKIGEKIEPLVAIEIKK